MNTTQAVARILKMEGVEWLACFPSNGLIEEAAKQGIRPIMFRQERGAFMALVVLGKKEVEKVKTIWESLSPVIRELIADTEQKHDGRWLWIRPLSKADLEAVKLLLSIKRRPKSSRSSQSELGTRFD